MDFDAYLAALPRLAALLQREGMAPGPDVWQNAYDLLLRLHQQRRWPADTAGLSRLLGPVLCRTPTEQALFPHLHEEALTGQRPPPEPAVIGSAPGRALQGWRTGLAELDRRWRRAALALGVSLIGFGAGIVAWPPNPLPAHDERIKPPQAVDAPTQPRNGRTPPDNGSVPIVNRVAPNRLPQPSGFPATWERWQTRIGYAAWALPWLAPVFWLSRQAARRLRFRRARSPGRALLRDLRFELPLQPLFGGPEAERELSGLRPVLFRRSRRLDVAATAEATAHHAGYFQPRFRARRITPLYLLLVRSLDRDDQRAALAEELAARFRELGIEVRTYRFRDDPRWLIRWEPDKLARPVELRTLTTEFAEAGLIVLSETELLFHPVTGHARAWVHDFRHWPRRIWLHPRDAGPAHAELLWRNAFLMLPLARHALAPLVRWLTATNETTLPPAAADCVPLPDVIADEPEAWLAPHPPYGADLGSLPWQLERFLGTPGLLLLRAVAVYPEPTWQLTLALDFLLFAERDGGRLERREQRLSRLSRLPWLRHAYLPQYLRELLVAGLDPEDREPVRDAWARLFGQLAEGRGRLTLSVATPERSKLRALLRDLVGTRQDPTLRDPIFLDLLAGRRLSPWDVPIPERIARRLPGRPRRLDLRIIPLLAAAGLAGWGLAMSWHTWGRPRLTGIWEQRIAADNARWPVTLVSGPATAGLAEALESALQTKGYAVTRQTGSAETPPSQNNIRHAPTARAAAKRLAESVRHTTYGAQPLLEATPGAAGIEVRLNQTHEAGAGFRDVLAFKSVTTFSDDLKGGGKAPEMVKIPAGAFRMGSPADEPDRNDDEGPQHLVTMAQPFALSRTEVTFDDYDRFGKATKRQLPEDNGRGRGNRPVINVRFDDAKAYADWLSAQTGRRYRLPTEAEWEYAARAGTTTPYWWGTEIGRNQANCDGCGSQWDKQQTAPAASFAPNPFGLYDTAGNVYEWTADCWHETYVGAPADGSAWLAEQKGGCSKRVVRGGSWGINPRYLRSAYRAGFRSDAAYFDLGFRVARDL